MEREKGKEVEKWGKKKEIKRGKKIGRIEGRIKCKRKGKSREEKWSSRK